jgi:hypothetical protein
MRRCSSRWSEPKGAGQHDAGVVDEDVRTAELLLDAVGRGEDRVAVGDIGLDGDRAVSELVGQDPDTVGAAGEQREPVAVGGQGAGGRFADARRRAGDDRDAVGVLVGAHAVTSSSASDEDSSR